MKLYEDEKVNRLLESLELFAEIANSKWFTKTAIILFLNKSDLFREKIQTKDLNILFDDYTGGCNYEKGVKYIQDKFVSLNKNPNKKIFAHITCATDTGTARLFSTVLMINPQRMSRWYSRPPRKSSSAKIWSDLALVLCDTASCTFRQNITICFWCITNCSETHRLLCCEMLWNICNYNCSICRSRKEGHVLLGDASSAVHGEDHGR